MAGGNKEGGPKSWSVLLQLCLASYFVHEVIWLKLLTTHNVITDERKTTLVRNQHHYAFP